LQGKEVQFLTVITREFFEILATIRQPTLAHVKKQHIPVHHQMGTSLERPLTWVEASREFDLQVWQIRVVYNG
jgi:hypothetical protein